MLKSIFFKLFCIKV